jgi:hypothetical protein
MDLHEALQLVKFDKRLIDWHLKQGIITQAEVDKHMKSLNDLSAQSIPVELSFDSYGNGTYSDQ